jgi:hypothetical protein
VTSERARLWQECEEARWGFSFQGNDGTREYVSVKVDRQGLEKLLVLTVRAQKTVS